MPTKLSLTSWGTLPFLKNTCNTENGLFRVATLESESNLIHTSWCYHTVTESEMLERQGIKQQVTDGYLFIQEKYLDLALGYLQHVLILTDLFPFGTGYMV